MGTMWSVTSDGDEKRGREGESRYDLRERAARDAIAGAPRIYVGVISDDDSCEVPMITFIDLIASYASSGLEILSQCTSCLSWCGRSAHASPMQ